MTKPLQGTAFRVMQAQLMNCDVNYEEPLECDNLGFISARKTVTWKKDIASCSKAPQECVGQNEKSLDRRQTDSKGTMRTRRVGVDRRRVGEARLQLGVNNDKTLRRERR